MFIDKQITKIRLGLSYKLAQYKIFNSDTIINQNCKCGKSENMKHYLIDCTTHKEHRNKVLIKIKK